MSRVFSRRSWILVAAGLLWCSAGLAQDEKGATVSSNGGAVVKLTPTSLRVNVEVSCDGKTLADALEKLKDRREATVKKIKAAGANADSIVVGDGKPIPAYRYSAPANPYSTYPSTGPNSYGPVLAPPVAPPAPLAPPPSSWQPYAPPSDGDAQKVFVSAMILADWPLEADGHEAMLLKAEKLKKRILEADLIGAKAAAEKAAGENSDAPTATSNVPYSAVQFLYGFKVSRKQREAAMADAFAKAKSHATELATAAGMQRGPLLDLSSFSNSTPFMYSMSLDQNEIFSTDVNAPCSFSVSVTAKFRLLEKDK